MGLIDQLLSRFPTRNSNGRIECFGDFLATLRPGSASFTFPGLSTVSHLLPGLSISWPQPSQPLASSLDLEQLDICCQSLVIAGPNRVNLLHLPWTQYIETFATRTLFTNSAVLQLTTWKTLELTISSIEIWQTKAWGPSYLSPSSWEV